jgi:hypothetical protein
MPRGVYPRTPPTERFWSKVDQDGPVPEHRPDLGPCWLWAGTEMARGYPYFKVNGRMVRAHRFAYKLLVGAIPEGLTLDHLCRVTLCVNPRHLEPVTHRVNILRGDGLAAHNAGVTACPKGHAYDERNTLRTRGKRQCRACSRERMRRHRSKIASRA